MASYQYPGFAGLGQWTAQAPPPAPLQYTAQTLPHFLPHPSLAVPYMAEVMYSSLQHPLPVHAWYGPLNKAQLVELKNLWLQYYQALPHGFAPILRIYRQSDSVTLITAAVTDPSLSTFIQGLPF